MAGHSRGKMQCIVLLLDSRQLTILLSPRAFGQELYEAVYRDLQLVETDYFGLEFKAADDTDRWLDKQKPIGAQIGSKSSVLLSFKVKFYPTDPTALKEEYTRYLFALQLRQDLASGRLQCCAPRTAALLAAHVLQSELGDHHEAAAAVGIGNGDGGEATANDETAYVRNIKLVAGQTAELERIMVELHRSLSGQRPSEADFNLLDAARKTDFYGVVLNQVKDADGVPQSLAVTETGILVFQNNQRVNVFPWAKIRKLCFRRKLFVVKLRPAADKAHPSNFVEFTFATRNRSKAFWKTCVEHHAFFCCQEAPINQAKHWQSQVLTRGSTFRYSGRTQVQLIDHVKDNLVKSRPFVRSQSFGTMASVRSCGTGSSLGSTARTLPAAARTGSAAAASAVVTASNFSALPRLVPKAGTASSDRLAVAAAVRASPGKAAVGHENGRADDVRALASAVAERCPLSEHDPEPVGPSWPSQLQPLAQTPSSRGADAVRAGTTSAGQPSNGSRSNVDYRRGSGGSPSSSSSSSSSAAEAGADDDDADDVDDAESLAKLEDAIRSLAAAELGATEASAAAATGGDPGASSQQRLARSAAEAERAARQQARDEVLVACRASSLRRSLRRLSTRSTEEEMAQLEDVSELAVRVMHADSAGGELSPAEEQRSQLPPIPPAPALGDWTAPAALGRGRRLSSLQDLCELASKVMQYDGELAVSTPLLAGGGSIPSILATTAAQIDAPTPGRAELSPSPPPLPIKQLGSADAQPPAKVHLAPLKPDVTFSGRGGGGGGRSLVVAAAAADAASPPDDGGGCEMSDAPPLPPKCNLPAAAPPGSLPRDFFRSGRAANAPTSWTAASAAAVCGGLASSEDLAIRLPVRCRAAAPGGGDASSSSSSPLSSCSSSSSSSLSSLTVRDAALVVARPDGHELHPAAVVAAPPPPRGSCSPQAADDRLLVVASDCDPSAAVAAAVGGRLPEVEPQPAAPPPSALPAEATVEAAAAGGARDSAGEPVQPLLAQGWRGCGPLSPDWDDVFVVDSATGSTEEALSAAAGGSSSRRP